MHSATTSATDRYSALALNRDIVGWRLEDQEMSESLRKTQKPDIERRVFGQPAQSASEYAMTVSSEYVRRCRPSDIVPRM
jgi:hypothetical protein